MDNNLALTNQDVLTVSYYAKEMGWETLIAQSFHRILYLSKVLDVFVEGSDNQMFNHLSFTVNIDGPFANTVNGSIAHLCSMELLEEKDGAVVFIKDGGIMNSIDERKKVWIRTVLLLLGKYGEERLFAFIINDPAFNEARITNSQLPLDMVNENKTIETLNSFKEAFEETLGTELNLDERKYIELYFDYVFGQIVK